MRRDRRHPRCSVMRLDWCSLHGRSRFRANHPPHSRLAGRSRFRREPLLRSGHPTSWILVMSRCPQEARKHFPATMSEAVPLRPVPKKGRCVHNPQTPLPYNLRRDRSRADIPSEISSLHRSGTRRGRFLWSGIAARPRTYHRASPVLRPGRTQRMRRCDRPRLPRKLLPDGSRGHR